MVDHGKRVYGSMIELLPCEENPTPLVRLRRVVPFRHAEVFAKLEWYNPFGAVKDRVAANMIRDAEERGALGEVKKLVEATSGNTGMGLAMLANLKSYTLTTPLSDAIPLEKRTVLRFFGADVIELDDSLCPAPGQPEGAMQRAADIGASPEFLQLNQYANSANPDAHSRTTGPEIWRQTDGKVTHFVAGLGTCGTITGTGRFLKDQNRLVKVLGVHPAEGHDIPGVRSLRQLKLTEFYCPDEYDGQIEIDNEEAFSMCLRLNREEGIIAGPSSGMALSGALRLIPDEPGVRAVVIFPDNVFKYTTSIVKHLSNLFPNTRGAAARAAGPSPAEKTLSALLNNVRRSPAMIDVGQLEELLDDDPTPAVIDVRAPDEFADGHIDGSINIPLDALAGESTLPQDHAQTIVTVCNVGKVSLEAVLILRSMGFRDVRNLMGGLSAWLGEGMPLFP